LLLRDYDRVKLEEVKASEFFGPSQSSQQLREKLLFAAKTRQPVLLTGETGVGKGHAAKLIHELGPRSLKSFVRFQPSLSSGDLVLSELFGHLKGAFTGAHENKKGLFLLADGGTLFLDEIDELSHEVQVALLGVLQEKKFRVLGSSEEKEIDVRIVCAGNRPLEESLTNGKLRKDLYHRIAHLELSIAPLRDRKEDIPVLVNLFLQEFNEEESFNVVELSAESLKALCGYEWPGNVRELKAKVEDAAYRAAFSGRSCVELEDFGDLKLKAVSATQQDFRSLVNLYQLELVLDALKRNDGNQVKASADLKLDRSTLRRILQRGES
jgi:DNA-binding NtrC family response regulator